MFVGVVCGVEFFAFEGAAVGLLVCVVEFLGLGLGLYIEDCMHTSSVS